MNWPPVFGCIAAIALCGCATDMHKNEAFYALVELDDTSRATEASNLRFVVSGIAEGRKVGQFDFDRFEIERVKILVRYFTPPSSERPSEVHKESFEIKLSELSSTGAPLLWETNPDGENSLPSARIIHDDGDFWLVILTSKLVKFCKFKTTAFENLDPQRIPKKVIEQVHLQKSSDPHWKANLMKHGKYFAK